MNKIQEEFEKWIISGCSQEAIDFSKKPCTNWISKTKSISFYDGYKAADLLPTGKDCPDCGGSGGVPTMPDGEPEMCKKCDTKGTIPLYYTPEQYEKIMGKPYPDDAPTWSLDPSMGNQCWSALVTHSEARSMISYAIVIANESGKPPVDYRPEE